MKKDANLMQVDIRSIFLAFLFQIEKYRIIF